MILTTAVVFCIGNCAFPGKYLISSVSTNFSVIIFVCCDDYVMGLSVLYLFVEFVTVLIRI